MENYIKIDDEIMRLKATGGTLIWYKEQFGTDYNQDLLELKIQKENQKIEDTFIKSVMIGSNLIWAMAKTVDTTIPMPQVWYLKYPALNIYNDQTFDIEVFNKVLEVANDTFDKSISMYNNDEREQGDPITAEGIISLCALCGLNIDDINKLPVGMIANVVTQYVNMRFGNDEDDEKNATQDDINNFFMM